jgi:hypothetical protein
MTEETTQEAVDTVEADGNVQISVEQILASILTTLGSVEVSLENLIKDYSGKNIAVNQDEETKALTFTLADKPEEAQAETE